MRQTPEELSSCHETISKKKHKMQSLLLEDRAVLVSWKNSSGKRIHKEGRF